MDTPLILSTVIIAVAAFLMGSLPTGYIAARAKGINIKAVGSGNIGATNVTRAMGKKWGALVLLIDAFKGFLPVSLVKLWFASAPVNQLSLLLVMAGFLAVAGHVFTPFLKFKGGKGIATTLGVLLAINPLLALSMILVWVVVFLATRVSALGALTAAVAMPVIVYFLYRGSPLSGTMILFAVVMMLFILFTHRENIQRILRGEELAFKKGKQ